jgi:hypothetical protein
LQLVGVEWERVGVDEQSDSGGDGELLDSPNHGQRGLRLLRQCEHECGTEQQPLLCRYGLERRWNWSLVVELCREQWGNQCALFRKLFQSTGSNQRHVRHL